PRARTAAGPTFPGPSGPSTGGTHRFLQIEVPEGPQERRGGRVVLGPEVRVPGACILGEQLVGEPQESLPSGRLQERQDAGAQGAQVLLGFPRPQAGGQEQPVVLGLDGGKRVICG
ncbi:hypothetical protein ACFQDE_20600, partial [Deinococcus caeni]|uniref:hypothetical protein n=1 Tax=Deinococcus caeni TaxID=569127 RepID=UPI0036113D7C